MASIKHLKKVRLRRQKRVRSKIFGTQTKPRLSVFRSSRYIYVQAIADDVGKTLAEASSISKELEGKLDGLKKVDAAKEIGKLIAKKLLDKKINDAVFDRGRFLYHGRVKALADAAREEGLNI